MAGWCWILAHQSSYLTVPDVGQPPRRVGQDYGTVSSCRSHTRWLLCVGASLSTIISAIPAENSLLREDNLQHGICELVTATNRVVLLYTIYAMRATNL